MQAALAHWACRFTDFSHTENMGRSFERWEAVSFSWERSMSVCANDIAASTSERRYASQQTEPFEVIRPGTAT
jgi:hypothetical protein